MLLAVLLIAAPLMTSPEKATDTGMVRQPPQPGSFPADVVIDDSDMQTGSASRPAYRDDGMVRTPRHDDDDEVDGDDADDDDHPRDKDGKRLHDYKRAGKHRPQRFVGFSVAVHGGVFVRARQDLAHIGWALGPAGEPGRLGGIFDGELVLEVGKHLRIGAAVIWDESKASGRGPDAGAIDVRQNATYRFLTGGLIVDGVIPIGRTVDMSLGATLGAGELSIDVFTARVDDFQNAAVDLRAIPKTDRLLLSGTALHVRPALGFRIKLGKRPFAAIDIRLGLNVYYVPKSSLRVADDMPLQNSPEVVDLHPYLMLGLALGDFGRRQ